MDRPNLDNVVVRILDPEQFWMLEEFCEEENIPVPNAEFAKVVAAIDMGTGKVIGLCAAQMQLHTEPMWIKKEYQGKQLWEEMSEVIEGYLDVLAFTNGVSIGAYNQPTNAAAERICRMRGYEKSDRPLYVKVYTGDRFARTLETKED